MQIDPPPKNVGEYAMFVLGTHVRAALISSKEFRDGATTSDMKAVFEGEVIAYILVDKMIRSANWPALQAAFDKEYPNA